MSTLLKYDPQYNYCLFDIPYIRENQEEIIQSCARALARINEVCEKNEANVTWFYHRYNVFSVSAGDKHFYKIYSELLSCVKLFFETAKINFDEQLWIQSWLNNHLPDQLLNRHDHQSPISGYMSIDPKNTETVFYYKHSDQVAYTIQNKPGLFYIGPGKIDHEVKNLSDYTGTRLTMAFDIDDIESTNLGMIPLVIQ